MDFFEYKKSFGQNFIKDDNIIKKIVNASEIDKDTIIVEIGPGGGSLSRQIVPLSNYAFLYEIDTRLKNILHDVLNGNNNYEIIFGDFLEQDIKYIRKKYVDKKVYVVANLPYYITTPIITKVLDEIYPEKIIIMVQKEVAIRLSSKCGSRDYGMISVLLGSRYDIKKLFDVSRKCFVPEPNVDSAVIKLEKNDQLGNVNKEKFEKLIKAAFQFKRKNLRNNLKEYNLTQIEKILVRNGYNLLNRAEDIPVKVFIEIAKDL